MRHVRVRRARLRIDVGAVSLRSGPLVYLRNLKEMLEGIRVQGLPASAQPCEVGIELRSERSLYEVLLWQSWW